MAKRSSRIFRFFLVFFTIVIGCIVIITFIGMIGDKTVENKIIADGESALKDLNSKKRDDPGNAWKFYSQAIEKAENIKSDRTLSEFLDGNKEIIAEVLEVIKNNQEVIDNIQEGSRQDYYSYPYKYEQGIAIENPEYMILRRGIDITCTKALHDLENGRSDVALDLLFSVMMAGKHLTTGSPLPYDQLIGLGFISKAVQVLSIGISSGAFNERQLEEISVFLDDLERHWPMMTTTLKGDLNLLKVTFGYLHTSIGELFLSDGAEMTFFRMFVFRLMSWRYMFSPKKALYSCSEMLEEVIADIEEIETEVIDSFEKKRTVAEKVQAIDKQTNEFGMKNRVFSMFSPVYLNLYRKKLREITKIRLLHLSSRIRMFRIKKRKFPENLQEIAKDLIIDFNTGEEWKYENFGDSVTLSSPGFDEKNRDDNISITLTVKDLTQYLEDKRRNFFESKKRKKELTN